MTNVIVTSAAPIAADALTLALAEAVEAFRDTEATYRQGKAIAADAFRAMPSPADVASAIANARARDAFPVSEWVANADGTGPRTYGEAIAVLAASPLYTRSVSRGSVEKHRSAWSLITDTGVSHDNADAYGDAWRIATGGAIAAAKAQALAIAGKPLPERAPALHALALSLVPTRAAKAAEAKAKAAAKREEAKAEEAKAEAKAAAMTPAQRVGAILAAAIRTEAATGTLAAEDWAAIARTLSTEAKAAEAKAGDTLPRVAPSPKAVAAKR